MENESLIIQPTTEDVDKIRGYRIVKWHEYKNYECVYCQYATLWLPRMEVHQAENDHPWAYPGQNPVPESEVRPEDEAPE